MREERLDVPCLVLFCYMISFITSVRLSWRFDGRSDTCFVLGPGAGMEVWLPNGPLFLFG